MKPLIKEMRKRRADHPNIKRDHMKEEPQFTEAPLLFEDAEYMLFIINKIFKQGGIASYFINIGICT